ncbi:MAG: NAD-dependent epimerase/dehydratase family protein [bacterium]|nr:NAD-dependent epimerase/dehydratase family protein [bacterium]
MANKKHTLLITGVSGYFGMKLVKYFCGKDDVAQIIGIDIIEPEYSNNKFHFIKHDVRDDMTPLFTAHTVHWAIHAAYILAPIHNKGLMEDININGTRNFLSACSSCGVKQVMQVSSTTAYGFYKDNPPLLNEESPLRGNNDFTYAKNKKELEFLCAEFMKNYPDICFTVIRPCFVVGPGFNNPLARHLRKKIVMLPMDTRDFQFVHEDDLVAVMYLLLKRKISGVYNITADGTMTFDEMIKMLGGIQFKIPPFLIYPLNNLAWFLRLTFFTEIPTPALNFMRFPWIADNDKIKKDLNYRFKYTTKEAFMDYASSGSQK